MPKSLKQEAYQIIRNKILSCEFAPNSFINEEQLCRELNVSRTPIRDAISRLEQENLIKIIAKKGIVVAPLNIKEINMIFETRILLEPYILANYGNRITDDIYDELDSIMNQIDRIEPISENLTSDYLSKLYDLDDKFHNILVGLSQNKYIIQCYANIKAQNTRLRVLSGNLNKKRLESTKEEHLKICNEILKRNYEKAAKALEEHLLASKEASFSVILSGDISLLF